MSSTCIAPPASSASRSGSRSGTPRTPGWRDAVVDVASRGGDADTNAAIVGALLGARDGVVRDPARSGLERVLAATQRGRRAVGRGAPSAAFAATSQAHSRLIRCGSLQLERAGRCRSIAGRSIPTSST